MQIQDVRHEKFTSTSAATLSARLVGWSGSLLSLSSDTFSGSLAITQIGGLTISRLTMDGDTLGLLAPEAGRTGVLLVFDKPAGFNFALTEHRPALLWHGQGLSTASWWGGGPVTLYLLTWPSSMSPIPSSFYLNALNKTAPGPEELGHVLKPRNAPTLGTTVDQVLSLGEVSRQPWDTRSTAGVVNQVSNAFIDALGESVADELPLSFSRQKFQLFLTTHDYLDRLSDWTAPNTEAMADVAGVPIRTLQDAFQSTVGISPKQLSRTMQLHRIRAYLDNARDDAQPLADIAKKAGFSSASHFSASFKQLFGASPSTISADNR